MLRLAIMVTPLGSSYAAGDLVYVAADPAPGASLRVHHVVPAREKTQGAWAEPSAIVYAPAGTAKDDLRLALACHRIARNFGCVLDEHTAAEAALAEVFARPLRGGP